VRKRNNESEQQPGYRSWRRKPEAACSRAGNSDCSDPVVPEMEQANSNSKGWTVRADCESVLPVKVTNSQPSAWRKPKRVLRMSAGPMSSRETGKKSAVDDDSFADPIPGLPGLANQRRSWREVLAWRTIRRQSSAEIMRAEARLTWTAWRKSRRTIGEDQLRCAVGASSSLQSRWPVRLAVLLWRKLQD